MGTLDLQQALLGLSVLDVLDLGVRALIIGWMIWISILDTRGGIIPNRLTGPVMLGFGGFQIAYGLLTIFVQSLDSEYYRIFGLLIAFAIIFGIWKLHFIGGGDAKFLMAIFALYPTMGFVAVLAFILLITTVMLLIVNMWGNSPVALGRQVWARIVTGNMLPTREELDERGKRYAWTFAVPGIVYTLLYWDGLREYSPGFEFIRGLFVS